VEELQAVRDPHQDELLSIPEFARRLGGVSRATIEAWLSRKRLRRTKVGRRTMIRASELERVIEDGGKSKPGPGRKAAPSQDAATDRSGETPEPVATPEAPPRRLYRPKKKAALAQTA